jgi:hypothetical protein
MSYRAVRGLSAVRMPLISDVIQASGDGGEAILVGPKREHYAEKRYPICEHALVGSVGER